MYVCIIGHRCGYSECKFVGNEKIHAGLRTGNVRELVERTGARTESRAYLHRAIVVQVALGYIFAGNHREGSAGLPRHHTVDLPSAQNRAYKSVLAVKSRKLPNVRCDEAVSMVKVRRPTIKRL